MILMSIDKLQEVLLQKKQKEQKKKINLAVTIIFLAFQGIAKILMSVNLSVITKQKKETLLIFLLMESHLHKQLYLKFVLLQKQIKVFIL